MTATLPPPPTRRSAPMPPVRYRRWLGARRETWIQYAVGVVVLALVLAPVVPTVYQSVLDAPLYSPKAGLSIQAYVDLFTKAGFGTVVANSLYFAVLTTIIAVVLAVLLAVVLIRTRVPGGRAMGSVLLWPIYISPLVLAFGWIIVYGPAGFVSVGVQDVIGFVPWDLYTIPGMAVTEAVALVPIGYLYCSGALRLSDPSLENSARTCGAGPLRILWSIVLPMMRPPILYSALLIFSTSLETLSVPLLFGRPAGINLFASFIYFNGVALSNPNYALVGAASVVTLVVMGMLVTVQALALRNARRFVAVRGKASRPRLFDLGGLRWVGFAFVLLYVIIGPLIPLAGLLLRSVTQILTPLLNPFSVLTLDNFSLIFSYPSYVESIGNSVIIALIGGAATTVLMCLAVVVARRSGFRFARVVEFTSLAPQVIPGIILGIGFFWAFTFIGPLNWIGGTLLALIIAFGVRSMPAAFGAIAPIVMQIGDELDQAARSLGADWWRTFARILFRLVMPGMFSAFVLLFVQMIKEFTPAVFLSNADTQVIGTTMLQLWLNGNTGSVAALACVQIAITAVFVMLAAKLFKVHVHA